MRGRKKTEERKPMNSWLLCALSLVVLILLLSGVTWAVLLPYRPLGLGDEEILSSF